MRPSFHRLSTALVSSTPFLDAAMEATVIYLEHLNALANGNHEEAQVVAHKFDQHLNVLRPLFCLQSQLEVGHFYSHKLWVALKHFHCEKEPMYASLEAFLGRRALRDRPRTLGYKTESQHHPQHAPNRRLRENAISFNLKEFPCPRECQYTAQQLHPFAVRHHDKFRGHWILRDPEICLTKKERSEDPW